MARRLEAADTIDTATHLLHRLQAEGWMLEAIHMTVESGTVTRDTKTPKVPVATVVTIRLVPIRG